MADSVTPHPVSPPLPAPRSRSGRPALPPHVRRVVTARFVSHLGGSAGFFVGLWGMAAYELDADPTSLAMLMGALALAQLIGSAIAGVLVDRWDPKRVLIAGELLFVPAILTLTTAQSMGDLTLRAPVAWFGSALVMTAVTSFPPYLVSASSPAELERANARVEAAGTLAFILGPVLGALTVRWSGIPAVFVVDAATSLVGLAVVWGVQVRAVEHRATRRGLGEFVEGFSVAYRTPAVALVLSLGLLTWLAFGAFGALEPLFFRDVLGTSAEALGYVNAVFGIGLFAGAVVLDRSAGRLTSLRSLTVFTALSGVGVFAYAGTAALPIVVAGALFWGGILGVLMPLLRTMLHLHTPEGYVGRVSGVFMVHHSAGELVPLAFAPALAAWLGVQRALLTAGVVMLVAVPFAWRPATRLDRERPVVPDPDRDVVERLGDVDDRSVSVSP